jgi:D-alanyl-D-alanine dipeptidase
VSLVEPPLGLVLPVCPLTLKQQISKETAIRRRPRSESQISGERVIEIGSVSVYDVYGARGTLLPRPILARKTVVELLGIAERLLPDPLKLCVLDGLRTVSDQLSLVKFYGVDEVRRGFVAEVTKLGPRAPHLTGGAIDVTIELQGVPLALGTDFDVFGPASSIYEPAADSPTVENLKAWLAFVMLSTGFAPHPKEWWHWSFGDDNWAEYYSLSHVLYDEV